MKTDPVLLEIMSHTLASITDEIGYTVKRIAHSLYIREADDFTSALVTVEGKVFAYPAKVGVSLFVDQDCGPTIRLVPDVEPGDVIITNHPYLSEGMASHLPDLHFLVPYFDAGRLVCYGWLYAHFSDVGGRVPGSLSPSNVDLFQEGLQIPPMKLCRRGEFVQDTLALIVANTRTPTSNIGDIRALVAAAMIAQQRISQVIAKYGVDVFVQSQYDLIEYAGLRARAVFRRIPDGDYESWDYMDDDLLCNIPVRLRVRMSVRDGIVELDFTGTDPQTPAAYNIPSCGKRNHWLTPRLMAFVVTYDKDIPRNSGLFDPIRVKVPKGSILNPEFPASVGLRATPATRLGDVILGALVQAVPTLVPAAPCGTAVPIVFSGQGRDGSTPAVLIVQWCDGGSGARLGLDGNDGRGGSNANMSNNPIETVEDGSPVVVESYALRPDSAGPGRWRGGVGITVTVRVLCDGASMLARNSDRFRFAPWGACGGRFASNTRTVRNLGRDDETEIGKIDQLELAAGDTLTMMIPGGGGYGDPLDRDPLATLADVQRGLVSIKGALRDYGVIVREGLVDVAATERARAGRAGAFDTRLGLDPERLAWGAVFDDEAMNMLVAKLERLPAGQRWATRKRLLEGAFPGLRTRGFKPTEVFSDVEGARNKLAALLARL